MHYYKHHIGDFRSGTSNMTRHERWLYRDLLDVYYEKEGPLSLNHEKIFHELSVENEDERRLIERLLRLKFIKTEHGYRHARCDAEIAIWNALGWHPHNPSLPPKRPPIDEWKAMRERIFERDNYTCTYCGQYGGRLECDHVYPVSRGGSSDDSNITTACKTCNRTKGTKTVDEWRAAV